MEKKNMTAVIDRCLNGDRLAQEELVLAVQNRVYYHCRKMLKDEDRALDVTQDVLLAMLTKLDTLQNPESFWTWLGGITANLCRNAINRGPREVQIPEDEEGNSLLDTYETLDEQTIPDKTLDNDETRRMIAELVDDLPDAQRQCVLLYYYDEMSVKDIAASLGVSENTVKSRLNYARKSIKEGVERYEKQGVKLYGLSPLPFLLFFLRRDAGACGMTEAQAAELARRVVETSAASSAVGSAAGTTAGVSGGKTAAGAAAAAKAAAGAGLLGLSSKVVAGLVAGAILIGGVAGGVLRGNNDKKDSKWKPMEYVAPPGWVDEPFDQVGGYFYEDCGIGITELEDEGADWKVRNCWYSTQAGEYFLYTWADLDDDRIIQAGFEAYDIPTQPVGWMDISMGDSYQNVLEKLGLQDIPPDANNVICRFYESGTGKGEYRTETIDHTARTVNLVYHATENADYRAVIWLDFKNDQLCEFHYDLSEAAFLREEDSSSFDDESGEPTGEVSDETQTEEANEFGADGISVKFNGELMELSTPFRVYSMLFTQTRDSYYAVEQDAPFTVTNNGNDESVYIEIDMLEYIRSEESFISQVVHDGEFVELDMLGEYWGDENEGLYLSAQMSTELSAGEGLYWVKSALGGEDVPTLKLRPGESATFRLPQREQDAVYVLFVRYQNAEGATDLPIQSFWITADDVRSPANDATPR